MNRNRQDEYTDEEEEEEEIPPPKAVLKAAPWPCLELQGSEELLISKIAEKGDEEMESKEYVP